MSLRAALEARGLLTIEARARWRFVEVLDRHGSRWLAVRVP